MDDQAKVTLNDAERIDRLRLIRSDNVGPRTFRMLIAHCGSAGAALRALPEMARRGGGKGTRVHSRDQAEREIDAAARIGVRFLAPHEAGYPPRLAALLEAAGIEAVVENHGVGGERTPEALERVNAVLNRGGDAFLLMEGSNDISRQISMETTLFNLGEMARRAQLRGIPTLHATVIPRVPWANVDADKELLGTYTTRTELRGFRTVNYVIVVNVLRKAEKQLADAEVAAVAAPSLQGVVATGLTVTATSPKADVRALRAALEAATPDDEGTVED